MISVVEYCKNKYYIKHMQLITFSNYKKILCNSPVLDINQIEYNKLVSSFKAIKL